MIFWGKMTSKNTIEGQGNGGTKEGGDESQQWEHGKASGKYRTLYNN